MSVSLPQRYQEFASLPQSLATISMARQRLIPFTLRMYGPQYRPGRHHHLIASTLETVERGDLQRVIIQVPPRHGKSTLASEHFPAWYLGRNPDKRIISCSYAAHLAYRFSRKARNMLDDPRWPFPGVQPRRDARTVSAWDIDAHRGGYVAAGVGGSITGIGCNVLVIDDAVKNQLEADSPVYRDRVWEWYQSTALTRVEPGGAVVLIMTRWHEDDLVGRALVDDPNGWTVIDLPAIADGGPDALNRQMGEALWPEQWSADTLAERRRTVGERTWTALYQQRPSPAGGAVFLREWWRRYSVLPPITEAAVFVDSAFKAGVGSDWSVFALWGRGDDGNFYLVDRWRARVQFPELVQAGHDMLARARSLLPGVRAIPLVVEDKASGQSAIQVWGRPSTTRDGVRLPSLPVIPYKIASGESKLARAEGVSPLAEAGRVYIPADAEWVGEFIEEHAAFPTGVHDDQVDTTSMALARLSRPRPSGMRSF